MQRKNPFTVKIVSSGETHISPEMMSMSPETKLAFQELITLARITKNRLLSQGYSIIRNKVIDPKGRVIYEDFKQQEN